MPIISDAGASHDSGQRDARRYHERLRGQIADALKQSIGDEKLISAGPDAKVRVPVKGNKRYRFVYNRGDMSGTGHSGDVKEGDGFKKGDESGSTAGTEPGEEMYEVWLDMDEVAQHLFEQLGLPRLMPRGHSAAQTEAIVFDDIARKGPLVDKKATLRTNLQRNAQMGTPKLGDFERGDLRYLTYREQPKPKTQAVVFFLMDVSGSMGEFEKRAAKIFFWWAAQFLRTKYTEVSLVFIAHTTTAIECSEEQFFGRVESGGTLVSSALKMALSIQQERFPVVDWNSYVLFASDGDNMPNDNQVCVQCIKQFKDAANLVGYMQIDPGNRYTWAGGTTNLMSILKLAEIPYLVSTRVRTDDDIWPALKAIFKADV